MFLLVAGQKVVLWTDITTATENMTQDQISRRWEDIFMMNCITQVSRGILATERPMESDLCTYTLKSNCR